MSPIANVTSFVSNPTECTLFAVSILSRAEPLDWLELQVLGIFPSLWNLDGVSRVSNQAWILCNHKASATAGCAPRRAGSLPVQDRKEGRDESGEPHKPIASGLAHSLVRSLGRSPHFAEINRAIVRVASVEPSLLLLLPWHWHGTNSAAATASFMRLLFIHPKTREAHPGHLVDQRSPTGQSGLKLRVFAKGPLRMRHLSLYGGNGRSFVNRDSCSSLFLLYMIRCLFARPRHKILPHATYIAYCLHSEKSQNAFPF